LYFEGKLPPNSVRGSRSDDCLIRTPYFSGSIKKTVTTKKIKRGWYEIIWLILSRCIRGSVSTKVMYQCSLNSELMRSYVSFLLAAKLLETREDEGGRTRLFTTELGIEFIQKFEEMLNLLEEAVQVTESDGGFPPAALSSSLDAKKRLAVGRPDARARRS
jgi:predicted transcriptional regulator